MLGILLLSLLTCKYNVSAFTPSSDSQSILRRIQKLHATVKSEENINSLSRHYEESNTSQQDQTRREWIHGTIATASFGILASRPKSSYAVSVMEDTITRSTTLIPTVSSSALCDPSVSTFRHPDRQRIVHILGTAHISSSSAEVARNLVKEVKPKAVFLELDAKRVSRALPPSTETTSSNTDSNSNMVASSSETSTNNLNNDNNNSNSSNSAVISSSSERELVRKKSVNLFANFNLKEKVMSSASQMLGNSIKGMYQKLESEGFSAGEEFIVAAREGLALGSKIILGDRDVEVTLRRMTEALAKTDIQKLLSSDSELEQKMKTLIPSSSSSSVEIPSGGEGDVSMTKDQLAAFVEVAKVKDNVKMLMATLESVAPEIYNAMVAERDEYMSNGLDKLDQFESIVAVMGIAHVDGVERRLRDRGWVQVNVRCPS